MKRSSIILLIGVLTEATLCVNVAASATGFSTLVGPPTIEPPPPAAGGDTYSPTPVMKAPTRSRGHIWPKRAEPTWPSRPLCIFPSQWVKRRCDREAGERRTWYDVCTMPIPRGAQRDEWMRVNRFHKSNFEQHLLGLGQPTYKLYGSCTMVGGMRRSDVFCFEYQDEDKDKHIVCADEEGYATRFGQQLDWKKVLGKLPPNTPTKQPDLSTTLPNTPLGQRGLARQGAFRKPTGKHPLFEVSIEAMIEYHHASVSAFMIDRASGKPLTQDVHLIGTVVERGQTSPTTVCEPEVLGPWHDTAKLFHDPDRDWGPYSRAKASCSQPDGIDLIALASGATLSFTAAMPTELIDKSLLAYSIIEA